MIYALTALSFFGLSFALRYALLSEPRIKMNERFALPKTPDAFKIKDDSYGCMRLGELDALLRSYRVAEKNYDKTHAEPNVWPYFAYLIMFGAFIDCIEASLIVCCLSIIGIVVVSFLGFWVSEKVFTNNVYIEPEWDSSVYKPNYYEKTQGLDAYVDSETNRCQNVIDTRMKFFNSRVQYINQKTGVYMSIAIAYAIASVYSLIMLLSFH